MRSGRIAVTGLGSLSAAGSDVRSLWENTAAGRVHVRTDYFAPLGRDISAYAVDELPVAAQERRLTRHADRSVLLALCAAKEAWHAAGLHHIDRSRTGLVIGSSRGPAGANSLADRHSPKNPTDSAYTTFSCISGIISAALEIHGCSMMTSATCISSAVALKAAMQMLDSGELDAVLVGGVDAPLVGSLFEQFAATKVLAAETGPEALRPFGRNRGGTVLGEGAAFVALETEASALKRGASIHGFIHHVAVSRDSSFRTGGNKKGEALRQMTEQTLRSMRQLPGEVNLLHLHGSGTHLNDAMESHCIQTVFGPEAQQPYSWATKGITGHTLGASSLFQLILTLEAFRHSFIPPTANGADRDPACAIRLSLGPGVETPLRTAVCLTSGFWGNTSCIGISSRDDRELP